MNDCQSVIVSVAKSLADPNAVAQAALSKNNWDPISNSPLWQPSSYTVGHPGIAAFLFQLAREDDVWLVPAHAHLEATAAALPHERQVSISSGPGALFAAVSVAAGYRDGQLYTRLLSSSLVWAIKYLQRCADSFGNQPMSWSTYDVFTGPSSVCRSLMSALPALNHTERIDATDAILKTLASLAQLAQVVDGHGTQVPGWWIANEQQPTARDRSGYPHGDFNVGLAHGIAGPLALLSLAAREGYLADGQLDFIGIASSWLKSWQLNHSDGPYWPCRVSWEEETGRVHVSNPLTRDAWCYGTPGSAWALALAGDVLGDLELLRFSLEALGAAATRDRRNWRTDGPTVCHGLAGLVRICAQAAVTFDDSALAQKVDLLTGELLALYDENFPFGFQHVTPAQSCGWSDATRFAELDSPGLLLGAAGVAGALLPNGSEPRGGWDSAFLLC